MEQTILTSRRKTELSIANVVFCLLVIFIHVSSEPVTSFAPHSIPYATVFIPWRLASFAVQGFIFLSGLKFFLNMPEKFSYKHFYLKRFITVVVPYIIFNAIYYLYFISIGYFPFVLGDLIKYIFNGTLVAPFYFIIVIVQFYALAPLWIRLVKKVNAAAVLVFSAILTLFVLLYLSELISLIFPNASGDYTTNLFASYLFYWLLGCYAGLNYEKFKSDVLKNRLLIIVVFCVATVADAVFSYISFSGLRSISFLESLHYIFRISAVIFAYTAVLSACQLRGLKNKLIISVDKVSYYIFLVHCLLIFIINGLMTRFGLNSISLRYLIRIAIVYTLSVLISLGIRIVTQNTKQLFSRERKA